ARGGGPLRGARPQGGQAAAPQGKPGGGGADGAGRSGGVLPAGRAGGPPRGAGSQPGAAEDARAGLPGDAAGGGSGWESFAAEAGCGSSGGCSGTVGLRLVILIVIRNRNRLWGTSITITNYD